jgi:hypothetical protein
MKLRIKGNSVLFRVTQSEAARLYETGRLDETVYFSLDGASKLVYALEHTNLSEIATLRYKSPEILIILSSNEVKEWIQPDRMGIYATIDLGTPGNLQLVVEKDVEFPENEA